MLQNVPCRLKPQLPFRALAEMRGVAVAVGVACLWRVNEVHCLAACGKRISQAFVDLTYVQDHEYQKQRPTLRLPSRASDAN